MACPIESHQFLTTWKETIDKSQNESFISSWVINKTYGYFGFVPENAKAIFVGTFPVPEDQTGGFFYHSTSNSFWLILSIISKTKLFSTDSKMQFLCDNRIGITDILKKVQRTDKDCIARSDKSLNALCLNNILQLLKDNKQISDIYLTSGGPKSKSLSGKSAGGWFGSHMRNTLSGSVKSLNISGATRTVMLKPNTIHLNLHYLLTPAPQDDQLGMYLRDNVNVVQKINKIKYLEEIRDLKLKYKCLQWAVYLSRLTTIINREFQEEIISQNLDILLFEKRK